MGRWGAWGGNKEQIFLLPEARDPSPEEGKAIIAVAHPRAFFGQTGKKKVENLGVRLRLGPNLLLRWIPFFSPATPAAARTGGEWVRYGSGAVT